METVKEFFQSVYDSYKDRIKSPFIGSFVISFVVYNWQAFAILFYSEWPIHCRIEWIEEHFYKKCNFWNPVYIALFYILILPYINLIFEGILSIYSNQKLFKKNKSRKNDLVTQKEEAKLLREIADAQAGTSEILTLNTTITNLNNEINNLTKKYNMEVDRHNETEKRSNELINEIQKDLDTARDAGKILSQELKDKNMKLRYSLIPPSINAIISELSTEEKINFVKLIDYGIYEIGGIYTPNTKYFDKYVSLKLFEVIDPALFVPKKLSDKGEYVYHILKHTL